MITISIDATITGTPTTATDGTVVLRALHFRTPGPALALTITCTGRLADTAAGLRTGDRIIVSAVTANATTINGRPALDITAGDLTVTHRAYAGRHRQTATSAAATADVEAHGRYLAWHGVVCSPQPRR
ncbi:hypothetical protein GCM10010123_02200 [Pilimelia anulata]|uniref:Uncharacterized protein n=1 Tax=Pilimelia anulata TaxID=53371 RepID=A0A8J3B2H6_9ACTN|nr:hypothetical protein [Pilimelia anulata]GGJ75837.1 hypothetical protein GCM10010123_02200 [Pilimelia anulata]